MLRKISVLIFLLLKSKIEIKTSKRECANNGAKIGVPKNEAENSDYHRILGKGFFIGAFAEGTRESKKWYNYNDYSELSWTKWITHPHGGVEGKADDEIVAHSRQFDETGNLSGWADFSISYNLSLEGIDFVKNDNPFLCEKEPSHQG